MGNMKAKLPGSTPTKSTPTILAHAHAHALLFDRVQKNKTIGRDRRSNTRLYGTARQLRLKCGGMQPFGCSAEALDIRRISLAFGLMNTNQWRGPDFIW